MDLREEIEVLSEEFKKSQEFLIAIGDEMRQRLLLVMMHHSDCKGMRVNDIAEKMNLSRPAVSHHLKILKDAGIVCMYREGTKNYYYFNQNMKEFDDLIKMLDHAKKVMGSLPKRGENI